MDAETTTSPEFARYAWAAALLLQRPALLTRFQSAYTHLAALPRNVRRRMYSSLVARRSSLVAGAFLLALSAGPLLVPRVQAASITAGGACSLVDAIKSANTDTSVGTCTAGSGADTITLTGDVLLTASYSTYYLSATGLPSITSTITIDGDGFAIERDSGAPEFRLLAVGSTGDLTLRDVTLSYGRSERSGGAVHSVGTLMLTRATVSYNDADYRGGAIYSAHGAAIVTDSTITYNYARMAGGILNLNGPLDITGTTISNNVAVYNSGGGIYNDAYGVLTVTNSTISGNTTLNNGGGIYTDQYGTTTVINSTIVDNESIAGRGGGGVYGWLGSNTTLIRTIVSGNNAVLGLEVMVNAGGVMTAANDNVFGHNGITNAYAFFNFAPYGSDVTATYDGTDPTLLAAILDTTLASNGGLTDTHDLVAGSPAIDLAPGGDCTAAPTNALDQRGAPRPFDGKAPATANDCDAGAVEFGSPVPGNGAVFVSAAAVGITYDAVAFGPHDILKWDGSAWSKWFDGTVAGLMPNGKAAHNVNAIWIPDPAGDAVYMSFAQNARFVPGIAGKVDGMDIVRWNGSGFSLWFDGQDVGLTNKSQEKIDALHVLDGSLSPVGSGCANYLLISTQGPGSVPGVGGPIKFSGEDVLGFCLVNDGAATTGVWHLLIDGSAEGMPHNSTASLSASDDGETIYLTTRAAFNVDSATGGHSTVYEFDRVTGAFSGPVFSAPDNGLTKFVDALDYP